MHMWKSRKDEDRPATSSTSASAASYFPARETPMDTPKPAEPRTEVAHIGKSVIIKGELSGSEDLYLDGEVEGSIELREHSLIIGPNGRVRANVHARDIVVHGKLDGNLQGNQRVELRKTAVLVGDIVTQRIVIEDGAYFKGSIDIQREAPKPEVRRETAAAVAGMSSGFSPVPAGSPSRELGQPPLLERKKY